MRSKKLKLGILFGCLIFLIIFYGKYLNKLPDVLTFMRNPGSCGSTAMKLDEAISIAGKSECSSEGTVSSWGADCNGYTGNWRLGFSPKEEHPGCGSVCVVDTNTKQAKINWMCTGLRQ